MHNYLSVNLILYVAGNLNTQGRTQTDRQTDTSITALGARNEREHVKEMELF